MQIENENVACVLCMDMALRDYKEKERASKPVELSTTAPNTGSPKLPLDVLKKYHRDFIESYYCADGFVIGADAFISFVERQLRASA